MSTLDRPDTIVLIHGFFLTPRSWEHWIPHYEKQGFRVIAPPYPGFEVEVEALNWDPEPVALLSVPKIIESLEEVMRNLRSPPILIGHAAGGAFTQILLDHGFGAVGVTLNSAPTEGVRTYPCSQLKTAVPLLEDPTHRSGPVRLTQEQWHYAFANTFSEEESLALYKRYHVPAAGNIVWDSALANIIPGPQEAHVHYDNDHRMPLLFIAGGADTLMPPEVQRSNAAHYTPEVITEVKEYEGFCHFLPVQKGWEQIADAALAWALEHAGKRPAHSSIPRQEQLDLQLGGRR